MIRDIYLFCTYCFFFFFQAEDGIRDIGVTGVQTCALPILPVLAVFFLTNPMAYTFGTFLDERYKPAFYDSAVSFVHPPLGLFPHVNPAELFVWLGVARGLQQLDLPLGPLAVRGHNAGFVLHFIPG